MGRPINLRPVDLGLLERLSIRWIRDPLRHLRIREGLEALEFATPPVPDGFRQIGIVLEIDEELERGRCRPFLTHEEQRDLWREKIDRLGESESLRWDQIRQAIAEGAVADLIVILKEGHESCRRQMARRFSANDAVLVRRWIPLIGEAFGERPTEVLERL